ALKRMAASHSLCLHKLALVGHASTTDSSRPACTAVAGSTPYTTDARCTGMAPVPGEGRGVHLSPLFTCLVPLPRPSPSSLSLFLWWPGTCRASTIRRLVSELRRSRSL